MKTAVDNFTTLIQEAGWHVTKQMENNHYKNSYPKYILSKIKQKANKNIFGKSKKLLIIRRN